MLRRLIDLHSHILPQLDDGARNLAQSVMIGKACWAEGISTIVATPHYYQEQSKNALSQRIEALSLVKKAFASEEIPIEVLAGFEVNAGVTLLNRNSFGSLTLHGTKWIMLERSYLYGNEFDEVIEVVFDKGLLPLIAHPERYAYFTDDFDNLDALVSRGAWTQLTSGAIAGDQGETIQHWCLRALELGLAHIVATDTHNLTSRAPRMQAAAQVIEQELGIDMVRHVMYDNPKKILGRKL